MATLLGVDLGSAESRTARAATNDRIPLRYAEIWIQISDNGHPIQWFATVAFTPKKLVYPLLGYAGCLQFFDATFFGEREELLLTPNDSFTRVQHEPTMLG